MTDHVAVLRRMRNFYASLIPDHPEKVTALDHAIAAVAERDALVARLGELEKAWRDMANRSWVPDERHYIEACADDLARVVAGNGGGDE